MHGMDVADACLFYCLIFNGAVITANEKVELQTVPRDFYKQLTQL